jgi:hypothetical protein
VAHQAPGKEITVTVAYFQLLLLLAGEVGVLLLPLAIMEVLAAAAGITVPAVLETHLQ